MQRVLTTSIAFVLTLSCTVVAQPGEDHNARAVIEKAIKAAGGEAKLAKLNAFTWKDKGTYYGMGDGLPYSGAFAIQWPGKFRLEIEGVFLVVLNDDKGWISAGGQTKELSKDELAVQVHDQRARYINSLLPLKDKAFQIKIVGDVKVEDQATRGVHVSRKGYPDVNLYFSTKTNLLVKSEFRTKSAEQQGKEVTQEEFYSDYRDVDGAKLAHKFVVKRDGKLFVEGEMSELNASPKLDAKLFERPAD